jgi:hypothetical protein
MTWRVGRKLGRTLYRDEVLVGMVDTPEIATAIVDAMNATTAEARCRDCGTALTVIPDGFGEAFSCPACDQR